MGRGRGDDICAWGGAWGVQFLRGVLRRNMPVPTRHVSARGASRRQTKTDNNMMSYLLFLLHFWTGLTTLNYLGNVNNKSASAEVVLANFVILQK